MFSCSSDDVSCSCGCSCETFSSFCEDGVTSTVIQPYPSRYASTHAWASELFTSTTDSVIIDLFCCNVFTVLTEWCGLDQRVAQIFQLGGCLFIGQEVFDHSEDRLAGASGIDDQQHEIAEEQTQHDAQKRGQQRLEAVALENILFHAFTSSLLAPAM